jgi:hypothetical protein
VKLADVKRQRIQLESLFDADELKEHCWELSALFESACMLNDILVRSNAHSEGNSLASQS